MMTATFAFGNGGAGCRGPELEFQDQTCSEPAAASPPVSSTFARAKRSAPADATSPPSSPPLTKFNRSTTTTFIYGQQEKFDLRLGDFFFFAEFNEANCVTRRGTSRYCPTVLSRRRSLMAHVGSRSEIGRPQSIAASVRASVGRMSTSRLCKLERRTWTTSRPMSEVALAVIVPTGRSPGTKSLAHQESRLDVAATRRSCDHIRRTRLLSRAFSLSSRTASKRNNAGSIQLNTVAVAKLYSLVHTGIGWMQQPFLHLTQNIKTTESKLGSRSDPDSWLATPHYRTSPRGSLGTPVELVRLSSQTRDWAACELHNRTTQSSSSSAFGRLLFHSSCSSSSTLWETLRWCSCSHRTTS